MTITRKLSGITLTLELSETELVTAYEEGRHLFTEKDVGYYVDERLSEADPRYRCIDWTDDVIHDAATRISAQMEAILRDSSLFSCLMEDYTDSMLKEYGIEV